MVKAKAGQKRKIFSVDQKSTDFYYINYLWQICIRLKLREQKKWKSAIKFRVNFSVATVGPEGLEQGGRVRLPGLLREGVRPGEDRHGQISNER